MRKFKRTTFERRCRKRDELLEDPGAVTFRQAERAPRDGKGMEPLHAMDALDDSDGGE